MPSRDSTDIDLIARDLQVPAEQVQRTLRLLDEGNTVAFLARFRKDQTGGLNEDQIHQIQRLATRQRLLSERKQTILKSIDSQGKLTSELESQIQTAPSTKQLEDLYLPFKPKKQTLATLARNRGLEPLACEIIDAEATANDLDLRADDFVSPDRELPSRAEVLNGVGHLLAERFGERADLRAKLRKILHETGEIACFQIENAGRADEKSTATSKSAASTEKTEATAADKTPGTLAVVDKHGSPQTDTTPTPPAASVDADKRPDQENRAATTKDRKRKRLERSLADYFGFREPISKLPPHRILAINRGERAKILRVKIEGDTDAMLAAATQFLIDEQHPHAEFLSACVRDALNRLVLPSLEREIRRELTEKAEEHAVQVFARNLRKLLLQPPIRGRRILAIDPGFRSGCKIVALDEFGNVLETGVIHVIGGEHRITQGRATLVEMIRRLEISAVAIGNGTACREAEQLVSETLSEELQDGVISYAVVNEAGTSYYSTSAIGSEELPDYDAEERGAISIGRRLLDPLSELVKINPANIGVGLYQHDVKAKHLRESLDTEIESSVNYVGVDVNTASPALLSYVSGLNQLTARRLYDHRREHGPFRNRSQLRDVTGIGEATIIQAAGFLRITDGDNPLDATWIHPESYDVAQRVLEHLGSSVEDLAQIVRQEKYRSDRGGSPSLEPTSDRNGATLAERVAHVEIDALAQEFGIGELLLKDILASLAKPDRDPRDDLPPPVFRTGIMKLEDLKPGMELSGTVLNVVDFGAFVDIGISDSALVHISRLADCYIRDPHEIVSVGDNLNVWVLDVDKARRRVSLTAVRPGSEQRQSGGRDRENPPAAANTKEIEKRSVHAPGPEPTPPDKRKRTRPPRPRTGKRPKGRRPSRPISDAMIDGSEPMRSFSDLIQYYENKQPRPDGKHPDCE